MAIQVFKCADGHETERTFKPAQKLPASIECRVRVCDSPEVKFHPNCACRKRAIRQTVYRVGVGGDLPTRGAF